MSITTNLDLICYKTMPVWTADSLPTMFREKHNTKEGTWAKLTILTGALRFDYLTEEGEVVSSHEFKAGDEVPFIEPQVWHKVAPLSDDLTCYLEFYCQPQELVVKKYALTATHSEVMNAFTYLAKDFPANEQGKRAAKVMDLGCGNGRNALFLGEMGFTVEGRDKNVESTAFVNRMALKESLDVIALEHDIQLEDLTEDYDFILSTVVLMFLQPEVIPNIIRNMQEHTKVGGYNLIVAAMSTPEYPCHMPFPFTFNEAELANYYQGWELLKYNEDLGHLHKVDANGNRIQLKFSTILARKVA